MKNKQTPSQKSYLPLTTQTEKQKPSISNCTAGTHYKMIIPQAVERKIEQTCLNIYSTEWSGILFYDYEGSFEEDNLVITCKDFLLMDIGSHTYTEFNDGKDTLEYAEKHPQIYDTLHLQGLIHSHCTFSTFFSGTDVNTLQEWGAERNNFVSLIVNNEGKYTAAITRKVSSKRQVKETFFTPFFGNGLKQGEREYEENIEEKIEYFILDIVKEEPAENIEIHQRIEEVRSRKTPIIRENNKLLYRSETPKYNYGNLNIDDEYPYDTSLFEKDPLYNKYTPNNVYKNLSSLPVTHKQNNKYCSYDEKTVHNIVVKILTGEYNIQEKDTTNIQKLSKDMPMVYTKKFGSLKSIQNANDFSTWAEYFVEDLLKDAMEEYFMYSPIYHNDIDDDPETSLVMAVIEELHKIKGKNMWIKEFIEILESYIEADYYKTY